MDGAIDLRLIITLGGILFSVAGAAAVGKMQIKVILENLADMEKRLRDRGKRGVRQHQQKGDGRQAKGHSDRHADQQQADDQRKKKDNFHQSCSPC